MGEEKPDEELMGKRKPAPRLSTTFCDVDSYRMTRLREFYTFAYEYSSAPHCDKLGQSFYFME
ncbi:single-stranded DNA-binding protein [Paenibacillus sp. FSL P4-0338]|uniref:hypothetical protein n=1 Tax=unclassified Paenibacillus TaxID=185978 RepID=UPI00096D6B06|nr:hypothetical protein [Paenibacillus sp. FSL R7-269]OMG01204.1 hypothetical protein BK147_02300 [Paenibacillus sp. FSL R7-0337]